MYPASEVRAAARAARAAGIDVDGDEGHAAIRVLERTGYLPRDRARVDALVERVTRAARIAVRERRHAPEQLALPLWGRYVDEPVEPVQLALPL